MLLQFKFKIYFSSVEITLLKKTKETEILMVSTTNTIKKQTFNPLKMVSCSAFWDIFH